MTSIFSFDRRVKCNHVGRYSNSELRCLLRRYRRKDVRPLHHSEATGMRYYQTEYCSCLTQRDSSATLRKGKEWRTLLLHLTILLDLPDLSCPPAKASTKWRVDISRLFRLTTNHSNSSTLPKKSPSRSPPWAPTSMATSTNSRSPLKTPPY